MELFLQLVLLFLVCIPSTTTTSENCFQPDPQKRDFLCPMTYAETGGFELSVSPSQEVTIECVKLSSFDISQLPNISVVPSNVLQMRFCPLPHDGFQAISERLRSNRPLLIEFEHGNSSSLTKNAFRNLSDLKFLILSGSRFDVIEGDVFDYVPNLVALTLRACGLTELNKTLFYNLMELEWLDLTDNLIEDLPEGLFHNLGKLQDLRLWNNNIKRLYDFTFQGLSSLVVLDVSGNKVESVSEGAFQHLNSLTNLSLSMNLITSLPTSLCQNNSLQLLLLDDNSNLELANHMLSDCSFLQEVDLSSCGLSDIPEEIFSNSTNLKTIMLRDNSLTTLPKELFENQVDVEHIDLSGNNLEHLELSLRKLRILSIGNNAIVDIDDRDFFELESLEELDLSNNRIRYIHPDAFSNNERLRVINLSKNRYSGDDLILANQVELEYVDLSRNLIAQVEHVVTLDNKPSLKKLDVSWNRIGNISLFHLQGVSNLEVNLEHNNITTVYFDHIDGISGAFTSTILLKNNPIRCDCHNYELVNYFHDSPTKRSKMFDIQNEDLKCSSPKEVEGRQLHSLPLSYLVCPLGSRECPKECSCSWRPFNKAVIIDCAHKNLTKVPKILKSLFEGMHVEINLRNNSLVDVDLSALGDVVVLDLSYNKLVNVSGLPKKLSVLFLDHNRLTTLRPPLLQTLSSAHLVNLTLDHNRWLCSCGTEILATFLRHHAKLVDHRTVLCYNSTTRLVDLHRKDLCYDIYVYILPLCFLISLISITILFFYMLKQQLKVFLFSKNLCLWWVSEEDLDKDKIYDAFISYSHLDEHFVVNTLLVELERQPEEYKLCLAIRDWFPGELISTHIVNSVVSSKRTIVILSENFLGSVWAKAEFQKAHAEAMSAGTSRVIVIVYGNVDVESITDKELKLYLKTNTYLTWGDQYFWAKLKYAMPHRERISV